MYAIRSYYGLCCGELFPYNSQLKLTLEMQSANHKYKNRRMKRIFLLAVGFVLLLQGSARADEGMWLPALIQKLNIVDMQRKGCRNNFV